MGNPASATSKVDLQASFSAPKGVTPIQGTVRRASWPFGARPKMREDHGKTMGKPWETGGLMGFNGILWDLMGFYGILWDLPSGKHT